MKCQNVTIHLISRLQQALQIPNFVYKPFRRGLKLTMAPSVEITTIKDGKCRLQ